MEAGRRVSTLAAVAALRRRLDLHRVALAVLVTVASFAVVYLITANVILRTRMLRAFVSEGPGVELDYASAYSVWPGLVHFRGLSLGVQDYERQFSVLADSGVVEVSLHDLLFRRFHAKRVVIDGLSFRFRHKVQPKEAATAQVAAFPSIFGFDDPPVYVGEKPAPLSDAEYDLWQIAIDDVRAELRELWFMQYRYLGGGRIARGGFRLQPARSFAVYPARVELTRGAVSVGDDVAVQRLAVELDGHVDYTDVRQVIGAELADKISGKLLVDAHGLNFAVLDSPAEARHPPRLEGSGDLTVAATVSAGRLEPESSAELSAPRVALSSSFGRLSGSLSSSLKALLDGRIEWTTSSPKLALSNASRYPGPVIGGPRLAIVLQSEKIGSRPRLSEVRLDVPQLLVPSLGWAKRWVQGTGLPIDVGGRLEGRAHLAWVRSRGPAARVHLRLADAELSSERIRASLGGEVDARIEPVERGSSSAGRIDIDLDGVEVERVRERRKPFRAAIRLPDLRVVLEPELGFSAGVEVTAKPADSLLSLALGSPMLEDLAADVFDLRGLEAKARVNVSRRAVRIELARAESGGLTGAGYWQRPATGDARGAFLISSKVANVGISLVGSDTEMDWFVPNDWLASGQRSGPKGGGAGSDESDAVSARGRRATEGARPAPEKARTSNRGSR
jgi:hypothetical protein